MTSPNLLKLNCDPTNYILYREKKKLINIVGNSIIRVLTNCNDTQKHNKVRIEHIKKKICRHQQKTNLINDVSQLLNYPQNGNGKTPFPSIKLFLFRVEI